jgi:hypothetical protein
MFRPATSNSRERPGVRSFLLGAMATARALATLEDPVDERSSRTGLAHEGRAHPHRRPLVRVRPRRAGAVAPRDQPCLSPIGD